MADEASAEQRDAAGFGQDVGDVGERPDLRRPVVDRVARRQRIFDAEVVAEIAARQEVAEIAGRALDHRARLEPAEAAAVDPDLAAVVQKARLGLEIDDAGGAVAVLRRQRAGDQLDRARDARIEGGAEAADAFGDDDAVEPILQVGVLVADVDHAIAVLDHARGLEQRLVEREVGAARLLLERFLVERILARAERRRDRIAGDVEPAAGDHDVARVPPPPAQRRCPKHLSAPLSGGAARLR